MGYKPFFFNWIDGKTLFKKQYEQAVKRYKAVNGCKLSIDDLDDEELRLFDLGANLDQLTWRRQKISTDGIETFRVEFPSTDDECFLTTGQQLFDSKRIDNTIGAIMQKLHIYQRKIVGLPTIYRTIS